MSVIMVTIELETLVFDVIPLALRAIVSLTVPLARLISTSQMEDAITVTGDITFRLGELLAPHVALIVCSAHL